MLLILALDDPNLRVVATNSRNANPAAFGAVIVAWEQPVPMLGINENLFVIAHGASVGDDGGPVIGDATQAHWVDPRSFAAMLLPSIPQGYTGSVFVSACQSADPPNGAFSFTEVFKAFLLDDRPRLGGVYGQHGLVVGLVPPPGSPAWVRA